MKRFKEDQDHYFPKFNLRQYLLTYCIMYDLIFESYTNPGLATCKKLKQNHVLIVK